jgi:hypothetical protein
LISKWRRDNSQTALVMLVWNWLIVIVEPIPTR